MFQSCLKTGLADSSTSQSPKDTSYVFSGYAPLSVKLVEQLEKPSGWEEVGAFPWQALLYCKYSISGTGRLCCTVGIVLVQAGALTGRLCRTVSIVLVQAVVLADFAVL